MCTARPLKALEIDNALILHMALLESAYLFYNDCIDARVRNSYRGQKHQCEASLPKTNSCERCRVDSTCSEAACKLGEGLCEMVDPQQIPSRPKPLTKSVNAYTEGPGPAQGLATSQWPYIRGLQDLVGKLWDSLMS